MSDVEEEVAGIEWEPDTCDCVVRFVFEREASTFRALKILKRCKLHEAIEDPQMLFETLLTHNRSFNTRVYDALNKDRDYELRREAKRAEKERSRVV